MSRAVFLDRDGVLNRNILYPDTECYESPRSAAEYELTQGATAALHRLQAAGFLLILVSNQPNAAKRKCTEGELVAIDARLHLLLLQAGISLHATYYCHHHPKVTGPCLCRKPKPFLLHRAEEEFNLDLTQCWMIGDRATDIECGRRAGCRTVWVDNSEDTARVKAADVTVRSLAEAAEIIVTAQPATMLRPKVANALPLHAAAAASAGKRPG